MLNYLLFTSSPILMSSKFRRDPRDMDEDEECWFQGDDDVDDEIDPTIDGCYRLEDTFDSEDIPPSKKERKSTLGKTSFLLPC